MKKYSVSIYCPSCHAKNVFEWDTKGQIQKIRSGGYVCAVCGEKNEDIKTGSKEMNLSQTQTMEQTSEKDEIIKRMAIDFSVADGEIAPFPHHFEYAKIAYKEIVRQVVKNVKPTL